MSVVTLILGGPWQQFSGIQLHHVVHVRTYRMLTHIHLSKGGS